MPEHKCHDCGKPADPAQTMNFDDIGKPPIFWCTKCGEENNKVQVGLEKLLKSDEKFKEKFAKELYKYNN
jgi:DNA-directed RNA polymerase subunit RPC12/RpoP